MMVHITKHLFLCLMIVHSTRRKNNLIFGFSTSKQLEELSFSNSYAHTLWKIISNQLYSSDKVMVHITKNSLFYV